MKHLTTEWPLLKELEEQLVRTLQKVFAVLLAALLEESVYQGFIRHPPQKILPILLGRLRNVSLIRFSFLLTMGQLRAALLLSMPHRQSHHPRKKRIDSLAIVRYDFVNGQKKGVYIWSDGLRFDRLT